MRTITKAGLTACVALGGGAFLIGSAIGHASHDRMVDDLVHEGFAGWADNAEVVATLHVDPTAALRWCGFEYPHIGQVLKI